MNLPHDYLNDYFNRDLILNDEEVLEILSSALLSVYKVKYTPNQIRQAFVIASQVQYIFGDYLKKIKNR